MKKKASNYRSKNWLEFRNEVIELDGNMCSRCGRTPEDGIVLQVHHRRYIRGLEPWQYDYKDCETICKGCHAEEHGIIMPKEGWEYIGEEDLGSLDGECEYCGNSLRYLFYIFHEKWGTLGVGTICCDDLTGATSASAWVRSQKRKKARVERFVESSRWRLEDGVHKIKQKGFDVEIQSIKQSYRITMNNTRGKQFYPTLMKAKIKTFEVIDSGDAEKYFTNAT